MKVFRIVQWKRKNGKQVGATLTLSSPASLPACKFSLHYPYKINCLVMRIKQTIIHSNFSKMKNKTLPTSLQVDYRDSLWEFGHTSCCEFGAERLKGRATGRLTNFSLSFRSQAFSTSKTEAFSVLYKCVIRWFRIQRRYGRFKSDQLP